MKIVEIEYSNRFLKKLRKIGKKFANIVDQQESIFRQNCFDQRLRTHKLHGKMSDYYSFSITHKHRILFKILSDGVVVFIDIGDHSIYQ